MRTRLAIVLALPWLLCAATGAAGVIQGTVTPRNRNPRATAARAHVTDVVVYVERVPAEVERKLTTRGFWFFRKHDGPRVWNVVQIDHRFDPNVLGIAAGDRIAFQNLDVIYHSAFSVSAARRFDLGKAQSRAARHRDVRPPRRDQPALRHPSRHGRLCRGDAQPRLRLPRHRRPLPAPRTSPAPTRSTPCIPCGAT